MLGQRKGSVLGSFWLKGTTHTSDREQQGNSLSLLQFDFSGDMLAKLEAYERDVALYEQASGEKISDGLRVRIVLNLVTHTELATHLLLNSERFQTWALCSTRTCGCLACKSSSVRSLPDARAKERIPREKVARRVRAKARGRPIRMSA